MVENEVAGLRQTRSKIIEQRRNGEWIIGDSPEDSLYEWARETTVEDIDVEIINDLIANYEAEKRSA